MSVSYIPPKTKFILWGKAAGRCQYKGCNEPLYLDKLTKEEFNQAYIAHIVADQPEGPRGHPTRSKELCSDISNLMLLCDTHHRLIDKQDIAGHPEDTLLEMKKFHENRIELQTGVSEDMESHILLYGANIGVHNSPLNYKESSEALFPLRYPGSRHPLELSFKNSVTQDDVDHFWPIEVHNLRTLFNTRVAPLIADGTIKHLSVFSLAPQPLLMELGRLIGEITKAEVHQRRREPTATWKWEPVEINTEFKVLKPKSTGKVVALNVSLSDHITEDRISQVLGHVPIWTLTIDKPDKDFLKSRSQLSAFRSTMRSLYGQIKAEHGQDAELHIFPAMPLSAAIEMGRVWMPKSDLPLHIYDQNAKINGFIKVHTILHK